VGSITDAQTGERLTGVNVLIVGTNVGRASDANGTYFIGPVNLGVCVILFSHVSYEQRRDTIRLERGGFLSYDVQLEKRTILMQEVEVTANRPKSTDYWKGVSGRVFTRADIEKTGVREFGDLIRFMMPGAFVTVMGSDVFIDLHKTSRRVYRPRFSDLQMYNPLVILNGVKIGKSPLALGFLIKPEEIDEIVILEAPESHMYGHEGRDGVIVVETTPQPPPTVLSLFEKILYVVGVAGATLLISILLL
jgi:hypothetical protein